jgi:hypothetical protein
MGTTPIVQPEKTSRGIAHTHTDTHMDHKIKARMFYIFRKQKKVKRSENVCRRIELKVGSPLN